MATYAELVGMVRDWSDRSDLSDALLGNFLDISARRIYNQLRIAPLEATARITVTSAHESGDGQTRIPVPTDLTELISVRSLNAGSNVTEFQYNQKESVRGFQERSSTFDDSVYYRRPSFIRRGSDYYLYPEAGEGAIVEFYYYRLLADLDALYSNTEDNRTAGFCTLPMGQPDMPENYVCVEAPNFLRDQQPEVLLYGALVEVSDYLGIKEDAARWEQKFQQKLADLMQEEKLREYRGGTVVQNFNVGNLI